ncbi:hypothetical protein M5D96_000977 [Drosophila gunungcola]|uniref:receptor protein-tyrosine kinase n=1 Tax=Drosophila gunungcola TaxID=103775 RepID=A0A9P9YXM3_9MUSC|nr:hypothetical protein M5D96_000977 [Drosophila gunungcola]
MQRQATKNKLKREKIKLESGMAATTADEVLSTIGAAKTTNAIGNICILCRQEMLLDTCCCRQSVEAVDMSASSVEAKSSSISTNGIENVNIYFDAPDCIVLEKKFVWVETISTGFKSWFTTKVESTGKKMGVKCSGNRSSNENDDDCMKNNRRRCEKFNIFSNCHNILRTMQSLLLLMLNCGIFNKRRRRQQHHQTNLNYTKFLLLLQALAAATTRLSLSPNNYNQQQLKHNSGTQQQKQKQQPDKQEWFHGLRHNHYWIRCLIWMLALNLLTIHATASVVLQQQAQHLPHNDITNNLNALSVSTQSRPPRSQSNGTIQLAHNVTPCKSMDIKNVASNFDQLENCTVIEGFLLIDLINDASPLNKSFPRLTEVTEFVMIYRVSGLHSLSKIFPNLSVIRGLKLFDGYAFIVYSNMDLTDLGLTRLRSITNGGVRIEKNQKLCFDKTIDWQHIMSENDTQLQVVLLENAKPQDCKDTKCPGEVRIGEDQNSNGGELHASCREYSSNQTRFCWDSKSCQTICPAECRNNCIDEHTCCHKDCLGGCIRDRNGIERCISCRNVSFNNICVETCPKNFYRYDSRCITAEECKTLSKIEAEEEMPVVPYEGKCTHRCPTGYHIANYTCVPCPGGKCEMRCPSGVIDSLERARKFHGCTILTGKDAVTISIKRESGAHVMQELTNSLSAVHRIESSLMVHLTYGLKSLKFFQSLTEISGESLTDQENFALYVLENRDLEELWNPNQTVFIRNGGVFFHFNPKLCVSTINKLLPMLASKPEFFDKRDVATDSNGNRGSCGTGILNVTAQSVSSGYARLQVTSKVEIGDPQKPSNATVIFKDPRAFIGFVFYHMIDPNKTASKSSDDPCDDRWKVSSPEKSGELLLGDLKPYTWYAYYVRTMAISSESTNAESEVEHFKTNPGQPSKVTDVVATAASDSKINVTWSYRNNPNGELTRFFIKAKLISRPSRNINRNYCTEPLAKAMDNELPATTPTKKTPNPLSGDCKCVEGSKKTSNQGYDDRFRQAGMGFENALQNFIFVPRMRKGKTGQDMNKDTAQGAALNSNAIANGGAKNPIRRKRDIALESDLDDMHGSVLLRHVRSLTDNSETGSEKNNETTYKDEATLSTNGKFYEVFAKELPPNQTSFVFNNLRHFTRYTIFVVACRKEMAGDRDIGPFCSDYDPVFPTTKKKEHADDAADLNVSLEPANNTESSVRIFWKPPADPNGEIVTYEVAYRLQKPDQVEEKKCIPVEDFNQTFGYPLKLNEGKYSFRVRANSLAGYGLFTDPEYREVEAPLSYGKYFIWFSGLAGALMIAILMAYVRHLHQDQQDVEQQEDATTPLRMGDYKSNMDQNSSLDQPAESPIALGDDPATHSPFSLQSGFIASSTPDGQTAIANAMPTAFQSLPMASNDAAAYVQPDPEALGVERGYEIYDPSPKCAELPTSRSGSTGGGGKLSGEQHLLPRKGRQPVIISSSMPDEVIGGSSLQPSTASAASSNASSHTGRYLKRVVADTLRNQANMINRHLFNHKRTGSNASHKSNASNAPSTSSNSNLTSHPVAMGNLGTIESGGSGSAGSYTGTPRFYTPSATPIGGGGGVVISDNPSYKALDFMGSMASEQPTILTTSSPNPNYEMMHPQGGQISANPNYVPMKEPPVQMAGVTISQNPNYQPMQAPLNAHQSSSDEDNEQEEDDEDEDEDVDDEHVEHIKMERMPLSRPRQKAVPSKSHPPRSRSVSQSRKSPTNPNSGVGTSGVGNMSNLLKESWLRPASTSRPPPPNGFIGRET